MIAYLLANWKQLAAAVLLAGAAGYAVHRPEQPAVTAKVDDKATQTGSSAKEIRKEEAPVHIVQRKFACPATPGAPPVLVEETTTDRGPVVTDTSARENHANAQEHKLDLTITPQARPGWALEVGAEDLLGGRQVRVGLRRRLFGPFWAGVGAVPARREIGASVSMEW